MAKPHPKPLKADQCPRCGTRMIKGAGLFRCPHCGFSPTPPERFREWSGEIERETTRDLVDEFKRIK